MLKSERFLLGAILSVVLCLGVGCGSKKYKEKPLDEELRSGTTQRGEKTGLRDNKLVIQKRSYVEEELWKLRSSFGELERRIYGESRLNPGGIWADLKSCRKRLADPRIGGTGRPAATERWEKITKEEQDLKYYIDDKKNVVGVGEEELEQRLVRYKKYKRILEDKYDDIKSKQDQCENNYKTALVQHGLDPQDTKAVGEWVQGPGGRRVWKMKKPPTYDPEELQRRKEQRERRQRENDN